MLFLRKIRQVRILPLPYHNICNCHKTVDMQPARYYKGNVFLVRMRRLHKQRLLPGNVERRQWVDQVSSA